MVITDGSVNAMAEDVAHRRMYIGGSFDVAGHTSGSFAPVDTLNGKLISGFPIVKGTVHTAIPDVTGGYYIAGKFDSVNDISVSNLAHVRGDISVDMNWKPVVNDTIYSIVMYGSDIYIG